MCFYTTIHFAFVIANYKKKKKENTKFKIFALFPTLSPMQQLYLATLAGWLALNVSKCKCLTFPNFINLTVTVICILRIINILSILCSFYSISSHSDMTSTCTSKNSGSRNLVRISYLKFLLERAVQHQRRPLQRGVSMSFFISCTSLPISHQVFQGLLRAHQDFHDTKHSITRLWIHECFR